MGAASLLAGCAGGLSGCEALLGGEAAAPSSRYLRSLSDPDAARWRAAADSALARPTPARIPSLRTFGFGGGAEAPGDSLAAAWRIAATRGRVLTLTLRADSAVFVDVYRADSLAPPLWIDGVEARDTVLRVEADVGGAVVVRVSGRIGAVRSGRLAVEDAPALAFPVAGPGRSIGSRFGVDRDGGARRHEGVDIFAPRGTPVVAAAAGIATPGENRLGGTVVWLRDGAHGLSHYYAHLDTVLIGPATRVRAGDTLGTVGTSGNARTTPPHLHFGLYDDGALDPSPFLDPPRRLPGDAAMASGASARNAAPGDRARSRRASGRDR